MIKEAGDQFERGSAAVACTTEIEPHISQVRMAAERSFERGSHDRHVFVPEATVNRDPETPVVGLTHHDSGSRHDRR